MLIERDHELARIIERTRTLRTGGVCLLVHGEPGSGKTSLLRAAIGRLPPGIDWLWNGCEPMLSAPPLGALTDLIDRLPPSLATAVRHGRATQDVLAGMLSLLRDRAAPIVGPPLCRDPHIDPKSPSRHRCQKTPESRLRWPTHDHKRQRCDARGIWALARKDAIERRNAVCAWARSGLRQRRHGLRKAQYLLAPPLAAGVVIAVAVAVAVAVPLQRFNKTRRLTFQPHHAHGQRLAGLAA